MKIICRLLFLWMISICIPSAYAERYTVDGYDMNIDIETSGSTLRITGRISDGEYCERLQIRFFVQAPGHRLAEVIGFVDRAGSGKRLIDAKREFRFTIPTQGWGIDSIYTECVGR